MAIVQGQTNTFKRQLYRGTINLLTDTLKMALYTGNASLGLNTTFYTTANEVSSVGTGYTAGGKTLTGVTVGLDTVNNIAFVNFNNVVWTPATFTARCALIYDATSSNFSIAVIDFGSDKTCSGTFTVTMPTNTSTTALIRSA
jgi:hypothetical protein